MTITTDRSLLQATRWERALFFVVAMAATAVLFAAMPAFDAAGEIRKSDIELLSAPTVVPPPIVEHHEESVDQKRETASVRTRIAPRIETPKPVQPVRPKSPSLELPIGSLRPGLGDLSVGFSIREAAPLPPPVSKAPTTFTIWDLDAPPRLLAPVKPTYPFRARRRRIEGYAEIEFEIRPDGTVGRVKIISDEPAGVFGEAAADAARRWRFSSPRKDGRIVTVTARQRIEFELE